MKPAATGLCPESLPALLLTGFSGLLCAILDWPWAAAACWALFWFSLHFFRDPERVIPHGQGLAVSPADGTIIRIEEKAAPISGRRCKCVSVFMDVFSVHVNRSPAAGEITDIRYHAGRFFNASLDKASSDNERCALALRSGDGDVFEFVQIAGLVARRIVCRARVGDRLERGERFGMIRFGSRVDIYLPESYEPAVSIGAKVRGGCDVLARKKA